MIFFTKRRRKKEFWPDLLPPVTGSEGAADGVDEDGIRWAELMKASLRCGPVLNDLKSILPSISWSNQSTSFTVKVVGPLGQRVQTITPLSQVCPLTQFFSVSFL